MLELFTGFHSPLISTKYLFSIILWYGKNSFSQLVKNEISRTINVYERYNYSSVDNHMRNNRTEDCE